MSFAFLALYTGDYLRDTRHLTPLKHGIYLLLLMHCWDQRGPLPLDEQECAGIANCRSADEIEALRYVMLRYFVRMEDGWYNKRMQAEVERARQISMVREDAGRRGANERMRRFRESQAIAKQVLGNCQASDATTTTTTTPTTTTTTSKPLSGSQANTDVAQPKSKRSDPNYEAAVRLLEFVNEKCGRHFRPKSSTLKPILARLREGYDERECRAVVARKLREWKGTDMEQYLRPATLFGAEKFAQYVGDVPPIDEVTDEA